MPFNISDGSNFKQTEQRKAAFKHLFNILQTTVNKTNPANESFETAHEVYFPDTLAQKPKFSTAAAPPHSRVRTWITGSGTGEDGLWNGYFSSSNTGDTTEGSELVEKVKMPLIRAQNTYGQFYWCWVKEDGDISSDGTSITYIEAGDAESDESLNTITDNNILANQTDRVRQWINPSKFGSAYSVTLRPATPNNEGISEGLVADTGATSFTGQKYGGWVFDYFVGGFFISAQQTSDIAPRLSGFTHPLWIEGYRYIGPTGSNIIVATASYALNAASSETSTGGTSSPGITHTLFQQPSADNTIGNVDADGVYDVNEYDWYRNHSHTPKDSNDIIEYRSVDGALIVSGTIGNRDLIYKLGSASYEDITVPTYGGSGASVYENDGQKNGGNIFSWNTSSLKQYPDLSSFGTFLTPASSSYTTHSFSFADTIRLHKIGLYFSNSDTTSPMKSTQPYISGSTTESFEAYQYPAGYDLYAQSSSAAGNYTLITSVRDIHENLRNAAVTGALYRTTDPYFPNFDGQINSNYFISTATSSLITDHNRYKYFRLYVSGGVFLESGTQYRQTIHHVDLWKNEDFTTGSRKQFNFKLNDTEVGRTGPFLDQLTEFDLIVSESARKLGYFSGSVIAEGFTSFAGGVLSETMTFKQSADEGGSIISGDIQHVNAITSSIISGSLVHAETLHSSASFLHGTTIIENLELVDEFSLSGSLKMRADSPIFFTNKTQTGDIGTDEFSARIFGHYTTAGVSDLYIDAYRIYNVADAKIDLRTLHPTLGRIQLQAPIVNVTGSLIMTGSIIANDISASGGISASKFIGDGSELSGVTSEWDGSRNGNASITGSLIVSSSTNSLRIIGNTQLSGSLTISGSILPNVDSTLTSSFDLGSSEAAWKDLHISEGTIKFYQTGSRNIANISVDTDGTIRFATGSVLAPVVMSQIFIGNTTGSNGVTLSDDGRGFIAVHNNGRHSTILRAEDQSLGTSLGRDYVAGTITQKGSGSFAILLDADNANVNRSKFSIESNSSVVGFATKLLTVSESGETRTYGHLKVDTNITASGDISASGTVIANAITATLNSGSGQSVVVLDTSNQLVTDEVHGNVFAPYIPKFASNPTGSENKILFINPADTNETALAVSNHQSTTDKMAIGGSVGSSPFKVYGDITVTAITASGDISSSGGITASGKVSANQIHAHSSTDSYTIYTTTIADIFASNQVRFGSDDKHTVIKGYTLQLGSGSNASVTMSGNISASKFIGDGSQLTGITIENQVVASPVTGSLIVSEHISTTNITASGQISASGVIIAPTLQGTLIGSSTGLAGTPSITITNITASGNISSSGTVTATSYNGSLSNMTGTIDGGVF